MNAEELIDRLADWSDSDDRVLAMGVCGSYARGDARPDSDLDVCLLCQTHGELLNDRTWAFELGSVTRMSEAVEDYRLVQSLRVFYGSLEVEYGVTHADWATPPIDDETAAVMRDGFRIFYDPDGRLSAALALATAMASDTRS